MVIHRHVFFVGFFFVTNVLMVRRFGQKCLLNSLNVSVNVKCWPTSLLQSYNFSVMMYNLNWKKL